MIIEFIISFNRSKLQNKKEKDPIERVVYDHRPQNVHKTAKVTTKRTNTRTMTTEQTEHWLLKCINDDVLETYNTVRGTLSKTQPITASDQSATAKPKDNEH